jgi:dienelactone hydrolase
MKWLARVAELMVLVLAGITLASAQGTATSGAAPQSVRAGEVPALWYPAPGQGKRPAVVALHGCSGMFASSGAVAARYPDWASLLNAAGYHVLAPDSFGARGVKEICSVPQSKRTIHEEDRRMDVFAVLQWLAARDDVDAKRIALLGFSHGAQTVLSSVDGSAKAVAEAPVRPVAAIAFYPGCTKFRNLAGYRVDSPLLVLIGEADDWTPAAPCKALAEKQPMKLVSYPDSYHGFDGTAPVRVRGNVGTTKSGNATQGGNPAAREASRAETLAFLKKHFSLP